MAFANDTPYQRQRLTQLRERAASTGNYLLPVAEADGWHCFVYNDSPEEANSALRTYFLRPPNGRSAGETDAFAQPANWEGFVFPTRELERLPMEVIVDSVTALGVRKQSFFWESLLSGVTSSDALRLEVGGNLAIPREMSVLWHYVLQYADMLNRANRTGQGLANLLQELPGEEAFANRLPVEQTLALLLQLCRRAYPAHWSANQFERLLGQADMAVREFITTHRETLQRGLELGRSNNAKLAERDFYGLYAASLPAVLLQELLDDASKEGLAGDTVIRPQEEVKGRRTFGERVKQFASEVARQQALLFSPDNAPASAPLYRAFGMGFVPEGKSAWYDLKHDDKQFMLGDWPISQPEKLPPVISARLNNYLLRLCNYLTSPILEWEREGNQVFPAWVLPTHGLAKATQRTYENEIKRARKELAELDKRLIDLRKVTTLSEVTEFQNRLSYLQSPLVRSRLQDALARQRRQIDAQKSYHNQRMKEFGIHDADESAYRKSLWLDEMLKIEEEVRPYLSYVRRAFASALPGGTTIEFDPYRHSHDGVEFDPDTVQSQEKWLRGDVMKTLQMRKHYTPIVQVNTFCLDYSRSMTHDLMRDLFKVVFALVMGLEGRKSFDAVHFFSSNFFEVVGYENSQQYTSRKILFRILRQVAEIYGGRIIYGGEGGTNISAGVAESHARMLAFTDKLREEQPGLKFVSSLFVLTDGQPTMGLTDLEELNAFINDTRQQGNIEINGIYLKHPDDKADFISQIFGKEHSVESSEFAGTIKTFVELMGRTYRAQRRDFRAEQKRRKLLGLDAAGNPVSPFKNNRP